MVQRLLWQQKIVSQVLSGNFANFDVREEIFGSLKSLRNSASTDLRNSENNPTNERMHFFSETDELLNK